ncbi:hypothetical protein RMATCC62417_11457 [Rhizopus microsporus]|nr:hypothetical protein RMATCC62417_11457 [Rhizopus microsporus]
MPIVNRNTSVQDVLPAPIPSTSCISAPIKSSKKYQNKVDKTEALKKEKEKNKTTDNEQKQVRCPSCDGTDHSHSSSKLCPVNKSKTKLSKPKDTVEKTSVIKTSLVNTCKYPKSVTMIQEVVATLLSVYYFLELLESGEELSVVTQNLFYNIFSIFASQEKHVFDSIKKSFMIFCESTSRTQSDLDKYASKGYMSIVSSGQTI